MLTYYYSNTFFLVNLVIFLIILSDKSKIKTTHGALIISIGFWTACIASVYILILKSAVLTEFQTGLLAFWPVIMISMVSSKVLSAVRQKEKKVFIDYAVKDLLEESLKSDPDKNNTCCARYLGIPSNTIKDQKSDKTGKLLWALFLSNYYEWQLSYQISITDNSLKIKIESTGKYSSNFQTNIREFKAYAETDIDIVCLYQNSGCEAHASGKNIHRKAGLFEVALVVRIKEGRSINTIILDCNLMASVKGRLFIEKVDLGMEGVASATINSNNKAEDFLQYGEEFEFICLPCNKPETGTRNN